MWSRGCGCMGFSAGSSEVREETQEPERGCVEKRCVATGWGKCRGVKDVKW